jgi:hypothetical protein
VSKNPPRFAFALVILLVSLSSCQDAATPTDVGRRPLGSISDAVHEAGNAHFFFLPPLVAAPKSNGIFDGSQSPVVTVCEWTASGCGADIANFTMTAGTGSEVVRVDGAGQQYIVNWHTDQCITGACKLSPSVTYRLRVLVDGTELGHADVLVAASHGAAKNIDANEYISLVNGRTLPVKFRIEQGAVDPMTTLPAAPSDAPQTLATPATPNGSLELTVPGGTLSEPMSISVQHVSVPASVSSTVVGGAVYELGPDGSRFATPLALTIAYNPANLAEGTSENALGLFTLVGDLWQPVPGSRVDPETHTVSGSITHFSTYGVRASATVSAAWYHSCGLGTKGAVVCWGDNSSGQLGTGSPVSSLIPIAVASSVSLTGVDAGTANACGLSSGSLYCWGTDSIGGFGGGRGAIATPTNVTPPSVSGVTTVDVGYQKICAVANGAAYCWEGGMLLSDQPTGVNGPAAFTSISAAIPEACGLTGTGRVYCWSYYLDVPHEVAVAGQTFTQVSGGVGQMCALTGVGDIYCWGRNYVGQLGDGSTTDRAQPVKVATPVPVTFTAVTSGYQHSCGLTSGGDIYCWGDNTYGQLGDGTPPSYTNGTSYVATPIPVKVAGGIQFESLSAGLFHTCGVSVAPSQPKSTAYCWGYNGYGQLGNGSTTDSPVPVQVTTLP